LKNIDEAVLINTVMMGCKDYYDHGDPEYATAVVYMYFFGERVNLSLFADGIKYEFDNIHKSLPNRWRYLFGYDSQLNKVNANNPIEVAEEILVKKRKGKRILMLSHKVNSLLGDSKLTDLERARIMAIFHHAGIHTKYMSQLRNDVISRSTDANVLWILTGEGRYFKEPFNRKYWSWILYDKDSYEEERESSILDDV
jgi:hypothetical protein